MVGDLCTVISPPYDMLDAETVRRLEQANNHNIVRLILSRRFERPYLAVRQRLETWRSASALLPDSGASLYVYEYTADGVTVRGLIGVAALREEAERVILPHEDVMPGPVDDRTVLMRTTRTNLEPILLVHQGSAALRALIAQIVAGAPLAETSALDTSTHRLWSTDDPACLAAIAEALAPSQVLIADGHHRYAAYLRLQHQQRDPAAPPESSPWDFGLAMLVDQDDHPLRVGPIHRSISALTLADLQELCESSGDRLDSSPDRATAVRDWEQGPSTPSEACFLVSDGESWALLRTPHTGGVDASVLHERLLEEWHVTEAQVGYHHSIDQGLHTIRRQPGLFVGVRPPSLAQVMATSAQGRRLPRKSTSFAPKPRMGMVMRDLRDV